MVPVGWLATVFQSTPPGGRRPNAPFDRANELSFNPRLRGGGDSNLSAISISSMFQSTPPGGRRLVFCITLEWRRRFNPRLRGGGDMSGTLQGQQVVIGGVFQSTPPGGRRRYSRFRCFQG